MTHILSNLYTLKNQIYKGQWDATVHWKSTNVSQEHAASTHYLTTSVALVRERIIPTERPPLVGKDSANFCG
jgi:hypothetical protein